MPASNLTPEQRRAEAKRRAAAEKARKDKAPKGRGPQGQGSTTRSQTVGGGNQGVTRPRGATPTASTQRHGRPPSSGGSTTRSQTVGGGNNGVTRPRGGTAPATPRPQPGAYQSRFAGARDAAHAAAAQIVPRSPAIGAPVHAQPRAFGSATQVQGGVLSGAPAPSVYAPQAGQVARPNAPVADPKTQPTAPANPYAGIGDVRGQAIPEGAAGMQQQPVQAGTQEYGGQNLQGIDKNGIDEERRRAFLDADNSLAGLKAVKELLNRRKLSISVEN